MKKSILAASLSTVLAIPSLASADTILGIYAGVGQWKAGLGGELGDQGDPTSIDELGFEDDDGTMIWAKLEHPIPLVPNVMLKHTSLSTNSSATFEEPRNLGGSEDFTGTVTTELDLSHTDATLYYEILDNWVTLDLGITVRKFAGHFNVNEGEANQELNDIDFTVPMAYGSAQFDLPLTGFHAGINLNALSIGDFSVTDTNIYAGYLGGPIPMLDIGFNVGYRDLSVKFEDDEEIYVDAGFDGVYFEVIAHF